ncbi:hypothetical protein DFQ28_002901 [Apophysomyces sp. BC1034]|nr:hypothetical protein DFQ30_005302 [Apophysomyces sp. BC1015]KAG0179362.1 hypothetical protein DFQ29_002220 [Apophysomyces sp. BC1021]KAG0189771.1 hypothetical protein DFQ28_002901 [Apophysomyces sp. BC1034]
MDRQRKMLIASFGRKNFKTAIISRLVNKKSGHVLDIRSSAFKKDKVIVQNKRKDGNQSQEWIYEGGCICSKVYPSMVLDIKGDSEKGGAQVLLYKRKDSDNMNQLWYFEPYHHFEQSLNMATTTMPLHKKESFGQPRLGYGAEVGVPPELTKLPENIKVVGVGANVDTTPTPTASSSLPHDQASDYHAPSQTQSAPQPQPAYPPPPPSSTSSYPPPPPPQQQQSPIPSYGQGPGYPPAPSPNLSTGYGGSVGYPPPPSPQHSTGYGYPSSPPQPPSVPNTGYPSGGYPPAPQPGYPPQQQHVGGFYRPPQTHQSGPPQMPMPGSGPTADGHGYGSYPPPQQQPPPTQYGGYPPPSY